MPTAADRLETMRNEFDRGGVDALLDRLIEDLRKEQDFPSLYQALQMRLRRDLGLPMLAPTPTDQLDEEAQRRLELGLVEACKEVGVGMIRAGSIREGFLYLRPVGDRSLVRGELDRVTPDDENIEDLIEILLGEGIDVGRGMRLLVDRMGTCQGITAMESELAHRSREDQAAAATALIENLHSELTATLSGEVAAKEGERPTDKTLRGLIVDRDWLFDDNNYHTDTTHLSAVVRFARVVSDRQVLAKAIDLTHYGSALAPMLQYPGDEPFAEQYPSHRLFFEALVGRRQDEAAKFFAEKAETLRESNFGAYAAETLVDLLDRIGRPREALAAYERFVDPRRPALGIAPDLIELSREAGDFELALSQATQRGGAYELARTLLAAKGER